METRLTALLLALSMMLGLVSCGGQPVGEETSPALLKLRLNPTA